MNGWAYGLIGAIGMVAMYSAPARRRWLQERRERKRLRDRREQRDRKKHHRTP